METGEDAARARLRHWILAPESVALIGASDSPDKVSYRPLQYLRQAGWGGCAYPVNPVRATVMGEQAWPSVAALPQVPDHAYVLTGSDAAVTAVRECAEAGVKVATVMADGFVPSDPGGAERREALLSIVREHDIRLIGPSSLGLANLHERFLLTANAAFAEPDLPAGSVFVASHSGSVIGALVSRGRAMGVGFAGVVSTGGEIDLSLGEICLATVDDPAVRSYALFLESLAGAEDLRTFARAAADAGKPVLAYKIGRSEAGAELSLSHTGALAGDDAVADEFLADLGIGRVDVFEALLEGQLLAGSVHLGERPQRAPRIAVVTTTGGGGAMMVDRLAMRGAQIRGPAPDTRRRLAELGVAAGDRLVDLTLAGTRYDVVRSALEVLLDAPEYDGVVAVIGSSARFHPDLAVRPVADCAGNGRPLAAFLVPDAPQAQALLREAGVAGFRTPEACADAIMAAFGRRRPSETVVRAIPDGPGNVLDEAESYDVLDRLDVPCAPHRVIEADAAVEGLPLPGPVAVKVLSAALPHKMDAGGVVLGVDSDEGLLEAVSQMRTSVRRAAGLEVDRVLVQQMSSGLGEVLVGYRHYPDAGPVVILAAGGVLAEVLEDRSIRCAPVDLATAREMIGEVRSLRALAGFRNAPPGDLEAVAEAVVALSRAALLDGAPVMEAEVNPLLVHAVGDGVTAVDALVRVADEVAREPAGP